MSKISGLKPKNRFMAGAAALIVVIAAVSAAVVMWPQQKSQTITAYFSAATDLYTGDHVTILGVPVGRVTKVTSQGGRVKVQLSINNGVQVPANAKAAIVTPTLVTTREVQLTPAYTGGPAMADGGSIPTSRTAVPVEWDQIEKEMNNLSTALGPKGQSHGALNNLLNTSANNLKGQGTNLHNTLTALSQATTTLSNNKGNLFATVDNLQQFVKVLDEANSQVNQFNQELTSVSGVLADNKTQLATALRTLNSSLGTVESFVKNNRTAVANNISGLDSVTANLAKNDQALADVLQRLPNEASNFNNIYDPTNHAITGSLALENFQDPASFVCSTIATVVTDKSAQEQDCQTALNPLLKTLSSSNLPALPNVSPLQRNPSGSGTAGSSNSSSSSGGLLGGLLNPGGSGGNK